MRNTPALMRWTVLLAAGWPVLTSAQNIPQSCLMSFNVKNKTFVSNNATMSCMLMEQRRGEMFTAINNFDAAGAVDGPALAKEIGAINSKLLQAESTVNWTAWGLNLSGNFLSTLGLASCVAPSPGCAGAVIGKVLSLVGIVDTATDEAAKRKASAELRADLDALQKKVAQAKPAMGSTRSQLVKDSIQLCDAVRQQCL